MLDETVDKSLHRLLDLFLEENKKLNLSAFRSEEDCWNGNILDSLAALQIIRPLPNPSPVTGEGQGVGATNTPHIQRGTGKLKYPQKSVIEHARAMRKNPTEVESLLWEALRKRSIDDCYFRRQRPIGNCILDFYCEKARLGIEVDGPIHNRKEEREWDKEREEQLLSLGIRIIHFKNKDILESIENVLAQIEDAIQYSPPPPCPTVAPKERRWMEEGLGVEVENIHRQKKLGAEAEPGMQSMKLLDIGTGGGFPLLPLALSLPAARHFGLDSTQKKIDAVQRIVNAMHIPNVTLLCGRAEELGRDSQHREQYDIVTVRGLAALNTLLEYASPFVKPGGYIVCWKSTKTEKELKDSLLARAELSCQLTTQHHYTLPEKWGERQLLVFVKRGPLSGKYPRAVGMPKKKPLI